MTQVTRMAGIVDHSAQVLSLLPLRLPRKPDGTYSNVAILGWLRPFSRAWRDAACASLDWECTKVRTLLQHNAYAIASLLIPTPVNT